MWDMFLLGDSTDSRLFEEYMMEVYRPVKIFKVIRGSELQTGGKYAMWLPLKDGSSISRLEI